MGLSIPPENDDDDDDDEPLNPLVEALFDEVEDLRLQVRSMETRYFRSH